jgi:hypothetical protein
VVAIGEAAPLVRAPFPMCSRSWRRARWPMRCIGPGT